MTLYHYTHNHSDDTLKFNQLDRKSMCTQSKKSIIAILFSDTAYRFYYINTTGEISEISVSENHIEQINV